MGLRKRRPEVATVPPDPEPSGPYTGARCWVAQDEYAQNPDGSYIKILEAGWHYSTRFVTVKHRIEVQAVEGEAPEVREWVEQQEVPDRKLHLNDTERDEENWFYEFADDTHRSWLEKHGPGRAIPLQPLAYGTEHPPEAHDGHPRHEEWLKEVSGG